MNSIAEEAETPSGIILLRTYLRTKGALLDTIFNTLGLPEIDFLMTSYHKSVWLADYES